MERSPSGSRFGQPTAHGLDASVTHALEAAEIQGALRPDGALANISTPAVVQELGLDFGDLLLGLIVPRPDSPQAERVDHQLRSDRPVAVRAPQPSAPRLVHGAGSQRVGWPPPFVRDRPVAGRRHAAPRIDRQPSPRDRPRAILSRPAHGRDRNVFGEHRHQHPNGREAVSGREHQDHPNHDL